ncbi:HAD-IB family hydrolase [Campylobacter insulaenigrae]|uniref:HAD-IB family hydrolase n=1 Tax=Campylobacter insulaenigrae TaxID=260714 RepID=UPI0021530B3C|nr:HAD-IB family hydrolase [Campylobacter insulaenigrae]MCR6571465.1 HAD-IB family hydrolase [Campylobacter insulaenigrae]MCR6583830.1 HAD-IB family hydrolase [Campylobacter insulaenigrae]
MKNDKILVLFDFCETITNFQTLENFLPIVAHKNPYFNQDINSTRRLKYQKLNIAYPKYEALIDCPIELIHEISKEFVFEKIIKNLNRNIMDKLFWHQDLGHEIAIVSGGLSIYIEDFAKIYEIDNVIAVDLEVSSGKLTGNIDGIHTMQERKLYKLSQMFDLKRYDLQKSYAYSDCVSDIPILSLVGNANVVECGKDLEWAKILGYEIIKKR